MVPPVSLEDALSNDAVSKYGMLREVELMSDLLRRRRLVGSHKTADQVARLMRKVVSQAKFSSFAQLIEHLESISEKLQKSAPRELVITGVTQRIIKFLDEEYTTALNRYIEDRLSVLSPESLQSQQAATTPGLQIDKNFSYPPASRDSVSNVETNATTTSSAGVPSLMKLLGHRSTLRNDPTGSGALPSPVTQFGSPDLGSPNQSGGNTPSLAASFSSLTPVTGALGGPTGVTGLIGPHGNIGHSHTHGSRTGTTRSTMGSSLSLSSSSFANGSKPEKISLEVQNTSSTPVTRDNLKSVLLANRGQMTPDVRDILEEDFSKDLTSLKAVFIEAITELLDEIELTYKNVADQALEHIHSDEFILTLGKSATVEAFLKAAARKRKFTVVVAETSPSFSGRLMAKELAASGISTILIPDANIYALMARCSKVVLGPHVVMADGSLLSIAGSQPICEAAREMRVPVIVCAGMYKFVPQYPNPADWALRDLGSPDEIIPMSDAAVPPKVINPYFDLVPADLVDLYITNLGGHPPSLLYRLLSDMYMI